MLEKAGRMALWPTFSTVMDASILDRPSRERLDSCQCSQTEMSATI